MTPPLPDLPLTLACLLAAGLFTALLCGAPVRWRNDNKCCRPLPPRSDRDWYDAMVGRAGIDC